MADLRPKRVALVHTVGITRSSIVGMLTATHRYDVQQYDTYLSLLRSPVSPDVVIATFDNVDRASINTMRNIRAAMPSTKLILMARPTYNERTRMLLGMGISSYLSPMSARIEDLIQAIDGEGVFSSEIVSAISMSVRDPKGVSEQERNRRRNLTSQEMLVLQALCEGHRNETIAVLLGIKPATVKFHVSHILGKLGADCRSKAVVIAREEGIV